MSLRPVRAGLVSIIAASLVACEHTSSGTVASGAHDSAQAVATPPVRSERDSSIADNGVTDNGVTDKASPRASMDTADPGAVVGAYLAALRRHAAARDTMLWEPATGSDDGFRTFRDTAVAAFHVGTPGRIEGAAGSRYVEVPLTVDLAAPTAPIRLRGIATLRRAVVDGASDAQRRWRIVRIQWSAPTARSLDSTTSHR
jgi:hypothetical protein